RKLLLKLKAEGKTIFLNSHLLGEVELVCDRVAILQQGRMICCGDIATLTQQQGRYLIGLAPGQDFPREEIAKSGYPVLPMGEFWEVQIADSQSIDPIVDLLRARRLSIRHLVEKRQSLEDLFMATVDSAEPGVDNRTTSKN